MRQNESLPFLNCPFWRDYVVGAVLIGIGFMFTGPGSPLKWFVAAAVGVLGILIFGCACGWSVVQSFRCRRPAA
jgi:hypothetical protein